MNNNTLNMLSVLTNDCFILIPTICVCELTTVTNYNFIEINNKANLGITTWKNKKIPLISILPNTNTHNQQAANTKFVLIISSLFTKSFQYYALKCDINPKIVQLNCHEMNANFTAEDNNNMIKYKIELPNSNFIVLDFATIELILAKFYDSYTNNSLNYIKEHIS